MNLIWTDIMANYVVGTKSNLNAGNTSVDNSFNLNVTGAKGPMIRVLRSRRKIQYDLRYGIPGIVFLAFHAIAIFFALAFWMTDRVHFEYLRTLLNQTATGRCMTVERHGDAARAPTVSTRKWIQAYGNEDLGFKKESSTEKSDSESNGGGAMESPPSVSEDEELSSTIERPVEQEQTIKMSAQKCGSLTSVVPKNRLILKDREDFINVSQSNNFKANDSLMSKN